MKNIIELKNLEQVENLQNNLLTFKDYFTGGKAFIGFDTVDELKAFAELNNGKIAILQKYRLNSFIGRDYIQNDNNIEELVKIRAAEYLLTEQNLFRWTFNFFTCLGVVINKD